MSETNEKVDKLNVLINKRNKLLNILKDKEDISNLSESKDENLAIEFEKVLNKCKECNNEIKQLKVELSPRFYLNFEEEENKYSQSNETSLIVKKENKIINWFKNKIGEFRFNYNMERALKRDNFIEENITNQIDSYNAYLNVIKVKGNKAIFKKHISKVNELNQRDFSNIISNKK